MRSVNLVALSLDFLVQSLALHDRSMDDKNWAKRLDVDGNEKMRAEHMVIMMENVFSLQAALKSSLQRAAHSL